MSINLTIYDDAYVEGNETFLVQLQILTNKANAAILSNTTTVMILDDDSKTNYCY